MGSLPRMTKPARSALMLGTGTAVVVIAILIGVAQGANNDTILVSRADGVDGETAGHDASDPSISADGRIVVFLSNLHPDLPGSTDDGIWARDLNAGTTRLVSRAGGVNGEPAEGPCCGPAISADGRFVVFTVQGAIDHPDDPDVVDDVFVRDLEASTTTLVSRASGVNGAKGNGNSGTWSVSGLGGQAISADGRFVAFSSVATNLDPLDNDSTADVFVRDLENHTTTLVSRATGPAGAKGNDHSGTPSISADGSRVAFTSTAGNLDPGDTDSGFSGQDIFMRDLKTPETKLVSRASTTSGVGGNGNSYQPAISADGGWVAFASGASNLDADDFDTVSDVFVRYFATEATTLVSRASTATGAKGSAASFGPAISADGRYVAFDSTADNLGLGASGFSDVFVRDLQLNELHLASRPDGLSGVSDGDSGDSAISGDGDIVAFTSSGELTPADDDDDFGRNDVYVRDMPFVGSPGGDLSIQITRPEDGSWVRDREFRLAGDINAPFEIVALCATAGRDSIPADCDDTDNALPGGTFAGLPVRRASGGTNQVTAWVRDIRGNMASHSITVEVGRVDLSVIDLDLTQGIQQFPSLTRNTAVVSEPAIGYRHRLATYFGAPLVTGKKAVARLYTEAAGGNCVPRVSAALHAFELRREGGRRSNWRSLPGSPLFPMEGARRVCATPLATQRPTPSGAGTFNFVLPDGWLRKANNPQIRLVGEVNPTFIDPRFRDPVSSNNALGLGIDGQYVHKPRRLTINPVRMTYGPVTPKGGTAPITGTGPSDPNASPPPDPASYFREFIDLVPFDVVVRPWRGEVGIGLRIKENAAGSSDMCSDVLDDLEQWEDRYEISDRGLPIDLDFTSFKPIIGVFDTNSRVCAGISQPSGNFIIDITEPVAVVAANRPLTSVAHETTHQLGFFHAGTNDQCYKNAGFENIFNEKWAVDDRGTINGWGLNTDEGTGGVAASPQDSGPFAIFGAPGTNFNGSLAPRPTQFFDYMSYCASVRGDISGNIAQDDAWLSVRNWIAMVRGDDPGPVIRPTASAAATGNGPTLRVSAILTATDEVSHFDVAPGALEADPPATGSPYRVVVRNSGGGVISDTAVGTRIMHVDQSTEPPDYFVEAEVPAGGAQSVELIRDDVVLFQRMRSPAAPKVKLLAPTGNARIGSGGNFAVRWSASDADGDPIVTDIDFSANGGKDWRPLSGGITGDSAQLSAALLQNTARAKIRVRANDGFNEAAAVSAPFRATGPKPTVRLVNPSPGARVPADVELQAEGEAFDDRGLPISGRNLRWLSGKKLLARGEHARIPAVKLGRELTLEARDRNGRTARKSIRLKVERVAPLFTKLSVPKSVGRRSRRLKLNLAATIPAKLAISGKEVATRKRCKKVKGKRRCKQVPVTARVPTRSRKVTVPLKPGKKTLKLKLRLSAGKKVTKHEVQIKHK